MEDIDENKIKQLDGSLLLVLRELLRLRRTTSVAQKLGLSQSAVSHALSRLRELFGRPLFVRKAYGLEPTRRALELAPRIDALLRAMSDALDVGDAFAPGTTTRGFRIAAPDHLTTVLAGPLLARFARNAPSARFAFSQRLGQDALAAVKNDEIDLALGRFRTRSDGLEVEPLFEDEYCLVARRNHPRLRRKLTRAGYAELEHVQISLAGDFRSFEIEPVTGSARPLRIVAAVPRFSIAFNVVAQSDAVTIAPSRLARHQAQSLGLRLHALPFPIEPIRVLAVRRPHADPGVAWLLGLIKQIGARKRG